MTKKADVIDLQLEAVRRTVDEMRRILEGKGPEVQGAVLAELLSMFLAGHHPDLRAQVLRMHMAAVEGLTEINAAAMLAEYGGKWPSKQ